MICPKCGIEDWCELVEEPVFNYNEYLTEKYQCLDVDCRCFFEARYKIMEIVEV